MLTLAILSPLLGALILAFATGLHERGARMLAVAVSAVPLVLLVAVWIGFDAGPGAPQFQAVAEVPWVPSLDVAWRVGVDGMSLALALMSALLFLGSIAWPAETRGRPRAYYAWFLFLEGVSLGLFLVLDLLLFYVFFDLSLVGMYFLIGRWGHGEAERAALKFFIYTLAGSLAFLLAILGLVLASPQGLTFDMRVLIDMQPLTGTGLYASLVLLGFLVGFAIKTPLFPFHTWLPSAHVDAPGPASAILAGVLLKMGTYGMVRIPFSMMTETFAAYALPLGIVAVISILWGAIVAFGQGNLKRRIAYTSVNHMGYTVLGIAAAGALVSGEAAARELALTGAVVEMIAHGLITGALFLIAGAFWQRGETYDLDAYGGLAATAPRLTGATVLAAFASLGLPGLAGFVAEFQIFAGTFAIYPWLAGIGLIGILITAALFLTMLQQLFFGPLPPRWSKLPDLGRTEGAVLAVLLVLVVVIGVYPAWLLTVIDSASAVIVGAG
ncbi:NADH-ubiquinone oxidoreductase chain M [Caenispirillum salinarum AK4]|uniref:NADH-ubiquinone oxidoreductase chain M n=1 Tax=Caenispirillum salinarum AK4 TaxID=1238182 RepID=K9HD64_9PROT|nr:NADH-quinone oxidoreductase subunit M [Caenispirillum salinarum]EKV26636.1 NADH-ubiquinone oxidoreductase chain M [Caenispirillum salinarum AK4]